MEEKLIICLLHNAVILTMLCYGGKNIFIKDASLFVEVWNIS